VLFVIIDSRSLPDRHVINADVCVVGAGVAGLSLVREFIGQPFRVCLLESGGSGPDRMTQSLLWGENVGHPYYPLDIAHASGFGGTSNRWTLKIGNNRLASG